MKLNRHVCLQGAVSLLLCSGRLLSQELHTFNFPTVGSYQLLAITPRTLELTFVTTKTPDPGRVNQFDLVDGNGQLRLLQATDFVVRAGEAVIPVKAVGFKRRVLYAPFKQRDLRIGNYLYLQLAVPLGDNQVVEVKTSNKTLWPPQWQLTTRTDPLRWNPAIHVNQTGYELEFSKKAMIGYYLGSMGELDFSTDMTGSGTSTNSNAAWPVFKIVDAGSNQEVFQGSLKPRRDQGFPYPTYQQVFEADFSNFKTAGEYKLFIPGLGTSFPFHVGEGVIGSFARTYSLGIYHQRCGTDNEAPFTRFVHRECHIAPVAVPGKSEFVDYVLEKETPDCKENSRHTAPQLKTASASLYPFVNRGPLDLRGGHHDAGDYSKYTINSASFIHALVFAADVFPGAAGLDNLGLPESGDGKSDLIQEAKWEADFLAKMQDADGGFYFLVYPREREYEQNVLPDRGDPQLVFPKTTAVTAAATAALAQCGSSPAFRKQFPEAAKQYLEQAKKGWTFLEAALAKHGKDGSYQKITHYGDFFMHDDELAWAACELFVATGDWAYHKKLLEWFDPSDPNTRRWGWLRLFDAYGSTIRSYAFAVKARKRVPADLQPFLLERCEAEIIAAGEEQLRRAENSAYGVSLPEEAKRAGSAGWFFSSDAAFDLATASQLHHPTFNDPRPKMLEAILSNLNYEQGCNPVNVTYVTGLGWKRQREIVHQYALNDRRVLPPTGIPIGSIQSGFGWLDLYKQELGTLSFPSDGAETHPYAFYDRWGDSFNLCQEFVILNQARALGYLAWLMGQSTLTNQPWRGQSAVITGIPAKVPAKTRLELSLSVPKESLEGARIVWETVGEQPVLGPKLSFTASRLGQQWIEAEAQLPDGRRFFASTNFTVSPR